MEFCLHGIGFGTARNSEVLKLESTNFQFHSGHLWYWSSGNKCPSIRRISNKLIERRLPKSISRIFLLYHVILRNQNTTNNSIFSDEKSTFTMRWAAREVFEFHSEPGLLDIRHFWIDATEMIFNSNNSPFNKKIIAEQSGHSFITHKIHYITPQHAEARYQTFHEGIGDITYVDTDDSPFMTDSQQLEYLRLVVGKDNVLFQTNHV